MWLFNAKKEQTGTMGSSLLDANLYPFSWFNSISVTDTQPRSVANDVSQPASQPASKQAIRRQSTEEQE